MDRSFALTCVALLALLPPGCVDATHQEAVDALGGETPGGPSPLHRPGQPCVLCHGELGPAESEFSLGGTVYLIRGEEEPAPRALVQIQDATGATFLTETNEAGNFWVVPRQWTPTYPIQTRVKYAGITKQMNQPINRAASCADCHTATKASPTDPFRIYIATNRSDIKARP